MGSAVGRRVRGPIGDRGRYLAQLTPCVAGSKGNIRLDHVQQKVELEYEDGPTARASITDHVRRDIVGHPWLCRGAGAQVKLDDDDAPDWIAARVDQLVDRRYHGGTDGHQVLGRPRPFRQAPRRRGLGCMLIASEDHVVPPPRRAVLVLRAIAAAARDDRRPPAPS